MDHRFETVRDLAFLSAIYVSTSARRTPRVTRSVPAEASCDQTLQLVILIAVHTCCGTLRHRIENLRQADLSRVSTPRAFGGVLLARFDARVDPAEQSELVTLLQDEVRTEVNSGPV